MKKEKINVEITELFLAQVSRDERYYGTIRRTRDTNNNPICYGKIKIRGGFIFSEGGNQDELGQKLDELAKLVVKQDIHRHAGITNKIAENKFYWN